MDPPEKAHHLKREREKRKLKLDWEAEDGAEEPDWRRRRRSTASGTDHAQATAEDAVALRRVAAQLEVKAFHRNHLWL